MANPPNHVYRITLLALILCAFSLRVYKLDSQSLWYDEGVTAIVAQYDLASLTQWTADDIQPPFYYILVAGWGRLAGWSEWSLRFVSVFFGLLMVPLLTVLAIRWSRSRLTGVLAALFAAFHPLLLYYSQEARMYSLLVALGTGIAYCVCGATHRQMKDVNAEAQRSKDAKREKQPPGEMGLWVWWGIYALAAVVALYTHYFAAFFLLAVNIAHLLHVIHVSRFTGHASRNSQFAIRNSLPWLAANAAVVLFYLPWLGTLFARLDVDTSYWGGRLKVWEALISVAIRFTSGETVLEAQAIRLLWMYGAVTLLALFGLLLRKSDLTDLAQPAIRNPQFATLILLVPIIAVLGLASFTPKFNARYVMVALPGLLLIWSAGLAELLRAFIPIWQRLQRVACNTEPRGIPAIAGLVGTGLLLAGFIQADMNWFTNSAFTKDQWREVAGYVQGQKVGDESVVLVSGHAWPVWRYYAPEIEPVRLPEIEILDVNAVVDMETSAAILRPTLQGKKGVWLIDWQAEVIDPTDAAGLQLNRAGNQQPLDAQFWGIRLRHFVDLDPKEISAAPPIQQPIQANFGNTVELLGSSVAEGGDLLLFWRLTDPQSPLPDLYLTGETRTESGLLYARLGDRRPAAYDFPTFRWQIGQIVVGRIPAAEWVGTGAPAGNYQLSLGVYDPAADAAGLDLFGPNDTRLGKRVLLPIVLDEPIPLVTDDDPTTWQGLLDGLFAQPILVGESVEAGDAVEFQLRWFSEDARTVGPLTVAWMGQDGERIGEVVQLPNSLTLAAGQALRTVHQLLVPAELLPGDYRLAVGLDSDPTRGVELPVTVLATERVFVLPTLEPALFATFGDQVTLAGLGGDDLPAQVRPGAVLPLTFVWQSTGEILTDYTMSVQWLDENGRPAGQRDEKLPRDSSLWLPNEVVSQIISLPAPQLPGIYRLIVAVYAANTDGLPRLRLPDGEDFVHVADIQIQP